HRLHPHQRGSRLPDPDCSAPGLGDRNPGWQPLQWGGNGADLLPLPFRGSRAGAPASLPAAGRHMSLATPRARPISWRKLTGNVFAWVALLFYVLIAVIPIWWMARATFVADYDLVDLQVNPFWF